MLICDMSYIHIGMEEYKDKFLWRGRLMSFTDSFVTCTFFTACFALLSHDDDLRPHDTLSVQLYEICDSPSIMVIQTSCLRGNYLF